MQAGPGGGCSEREFAASVVETAGEIDALQLGEGPGQLFGVTRSVEQRSDTSVEPLLLEGVHEFPPHPQRRHRVGRKNEDEPIAATQRSADLVVPSLGAPDVGVAVPIRNAMMAQNADQPLGEQLICMRVRDEDLGRHLRAAPAEAQAWLMSASAIGLTSGSPLSGSGRSTQCSLRTIQGISLFGSRSRPPTATGISRFL